MIGAYYKRLTSPDRKVMNVAAKIWSAWEGSTIHLQPDPRTVASFKKPDCAAAFARIECHYFLNRGFMRSDNQLLDDIGRIPHIPAVIAGHSAFDPGITHELVSATDRFATKPSRRRSWRANP
jgi:proline iminopeptidase